MLGPRPAWSEAAFAAALILGAALLAVAITEIRMLPQYSRIGPRFFPVAATVALALGGLSLLVVALRGGWRGRDATARAARRQTDWRAGAVIAAALALMAAVITLIGFLPAAVLLFTATAFAFGSRRPQVDLLVGFAVSLVVYLGFTRGLAIGLPQGPLETLLGRIL